MTTIAWTPGCFAADSCITHADENAMPGHRTIARKLKVHWLEKPRRGGVRLLALASKGAAAVGATLDALVEQQCLTLINSRSKSDLAKALNRPALLKKRRDVIADNDVAQLLTCWYAEEDHCYLIEQNGLVQRIEEPYFAIGWDSAPAYGSLRAGKDALFAVESATMFGVYTAKPIHYVRRGATGLEVLTAT
jgi:hypothetical protein